MPATPPLPLLRRVPPGAWIAIAWCAITVYSFGVLIGLPGEGPGPLFTMTVIPPQWVNMAWATVVVMAGSALLRRRPLPAVVLLVLGSVGAAMALNSSEINLLQYLTVDIAVCFAAADRSRRVSLMALGPAVFGLVGYTTVRVQMNFVIGASTELAVALTAAVAWFIGNSTHQSRLVGRGLSNSEIAAELYLSVTTVKTYLTRLLAKLDARDRVQLVILAYESGLVIPPR